MRTLTIILIMLFTLGGTQLFAQQESSKSSQQVDKNGVYYVVDEMPTFPGGTEAMMQYLQKNVKYPVEAQEKGVSGNVILQFVVDKKGGLKDIAVIRGVDPLLDVEALRVVSAMPKWVPGRMKGKVVPVRYSVPVSFKLVGQETPSVILKKQEEEIKNTSLTGVWQQCSANKDNLGNYSISTLPALKIISPDKTFMNMLLTIGGKSSIITIRGTIEQPSNDTYVELLKQSAISVFSPGTKIEMHIEFLNDNLIKLDFTASWNGMHIEEYWLRLVEPKMKSLMVN